MVLGVFLTKCGLFLRCSALGVLSGGSLAPRRSGAHPNMSKNVFFGIVGVCAGSRRLFF